MDSSREGKTLRNQGGEKKMPRVMALLFTVSVHGILAGDWSVDLPAGPICAMTGSSVLLPCSYDYPQSSNGRGEEQISDKHPGFEQGGPEERLHVVSEMWCREDSHCITPRYVYHSDGIFPEPSYQNRVQYLGEAGTKNCSLRISELRESDSGTYVFYLITNHRTQKMPEQSGIQLLVADSPNAVTVSASPFDIIGDRALRLACCSLAADPQARFRWYKDGTNPNPRHSGQTWNISKVTPDDSGSYYCQIQNKDKVQNSSLLAIDVQYAPRNTVVSISTEKRNETLLVELTCSSDANPPVHTYTWYQGEACVSTTDKSFHQGRQTMATPREKGQTSTRVTISVNEFGQHCCEARNRHGSQMYTVTLEGSKEGTVSGQMVILGVLLAVFIAIIAVIAFIISRRLTSVRQQAVIAKSDCACTMTVQNLDS